MKLSQKISKAEPLPDPVEDPDMGAQEPPPAPAPVPVADEDMIAAMTDVMGGSGDARFRSTRIVQRFKDNSWRVTHTGD